MDEVTTDKARIKLPPEPIERDVLWEIFYAFCMSHAWTMQEDAFLFSRDALDEIKRFDEFAFNDWYLRNAYRYEKMRETDRRAARYILRRFINEANKERRRKAG